MSAHAMCKASHQGIGLAAVELNDIRHVFATAVPQCGGTLREQADNALLSLDDLLSLQSPKFSRAMALAHGPDMTIFISGTASITNSESRHLGDAVAQTHEALNNIEALISEENLARHGLPGFGSSLEGLAQVRVYVKRKEDYPRILTVCARRLGDVPAIYTMADVCRPELLVEIEGIAFSRREPSPSISALRGPHFRETAPRPRIVARPAQV